MDTKVINKILKMADERNDLKNQLAIIDEKLKKEFGNIDAEYIKGNLELDSIKFEVEVDETEKVEGIKWKPEFEKYVKSKKEDFNVVVKKISKKCTVWQKRNYRIIKLQAKNKGCRNVLHSQSVVGKKVK